MIKKYTSPKITLETLVIESTIAAGSSLIKPGNPNTPFIPELDDWESSGSDERDYDI